MTIHHKRDETNKLKEFIENEKQALTQRIQYFENDKDLVNKFLIDVKRQAEQATLESEQEAKRKKELQMELNRMKSKKDQILAQIDKLKDQYDNLQKYKTFVMNIYNKHKDIIKQITEKEEGVVQNRKTTEKKKISSVQKPYFLTELDRNNENQLENDGEEQELQKSQKYKSQQRELIPYKSEMLISIKERDEEKNLLYVTSKNEWEDKQSEINKVYIETMKKYELKQQENEQKLFELERYKKLIEKQIGELIKNQEQYQIQKPELLRQAEKYVKQKENEKIKSEQKRILEEEKTKKYQMRVQKREKAIENMRHGKKIMEKSLYKKEVQQVQQIVKKVDDDEKYLDDSFIPCVNINDCK